MKLTFNDYEPGFVWAEKTTLGERRTGEKQMNLGEKKACKDSR